jgi:hypothetical protein
MSKKAVQPRQQNDNILVSREHNSDGTLSDVNSPNGTLNEGPGEYLTGSSKRSRGT